MAKKTVKHPPCGWSCGCWNAFGMVLWVAAFVSLVFAWLSGNGEMIFGFDEGEWFGNALILGILAIPLQLKATAACSGICFPEMERKE
ncbi:MAG: hypothetical protein AAB407_01970 [Patescibacteria group bacterium]